MSSHRAQFRVGQLVHHKRFDYRGVIVDVDATFQGTEEWYETMAQSRPPKDRPWYHVLVDQAAHMTYVTEQNLEPDLTGEPIAHPALDQFFNELRDGLYVPDRPVH
ncbi:MAG: heat shock protein HspQ [Alphaproteobacteria bacterium]|nr:heat shock protein HspQ [Alphaproteobacteria bacterium]